MTGHESAEDVEGERGLSDLECEINSLTASLFNFSINQVYKYLRLY